MRIAVVDALAAVPWHDHYLCSHLGLAGHDVVLATSPFVHGDIPRPSRYRYEPCFFPVFRRWPAFWARARFFRQVVRVLTYPLGWRRLRKLVQAQRADVVHFHWSLDPSLDGRLVPGLKKLGPKVLCSLHNVERRVGDSSRGTRWSPLAGKADGVMVYSEASAQVLHRRYPDLLTPVFKMPLGPGIDRVSVGRRQARQHLGLAEEAPTALFFGIVKPHKGLDDLLRAWSRVVARCGDACLMVAGHPGEHFWPYQKLIAGLGLEKSVYLDLRYIPEEQVGHYFAATDVVMLPYREASQSAVLSTAYACARPVVVTSIPGLKEAVVPGKSGLLAPPCDPHGLAEQILELFSDGPRARRMGAFAQKLMERSSSWPVVAERTLEVYRSVLGE